MEKEFINRLKGEPFNRLINAIGFYTYPSGDRMGTSRSEDFQYVVIRTWDHDFNKSQDYVEDCLYVNDYEVKHWLSTENYMNNHNKFMAKEFGDEWCERAKKYFSCLKRDKDVMRINAIQARLNEDDEYKM